MKKSDELKQQLEAAKAKAAELKQKHAELEIALENCEKEYNDLTGYCRRGFGEIGTLEKQLKSALRQEADEGVPFPVWVKANTYGGTLIISRITPKCIFLRNVGGERETIYKINAVRTEARTSYGGDGVIDVPATVAVWKQYQKGLKGVCAK